MGYGEDEMTNKKEHTGWKLDLNKSNHTGNICCKGCYELGKKESKNKQLDTSSGKALNNFAKESRKEVIKEVEDFFDIEQLQEEDYWECGVNEIRDFIKKLKQTE